MTNNQVIAEIIENLQSQIDLVDKKCSILHNTVTRLTSLIINLIQDNELKLRPIEETPDATPPSATG